MPDPSAAPDPRSPVHGNLPLEGDARDDLSLLPWHRREFQSIALPPSFPQTTPPPKFALGTRCRWIPLPETDWGTIIGQAYTPIEVGVEPPHTPPWSWFYLLLLDRDSPSQQWLAADWVAEADLERLPAPSTTQEA